MQILLGQVMEASAITKRYSINKEAVELEKILLPNHRFLSCQKRCPFPFSANDVCAPVDPTPSNWDMEEM